MKTKLQIQQQINELNNQIKFLEKSVFGKKERIDYLGIDLIKFAEYKEGDMFNIDGRSYKLYSMRYDKCSSSICYRLEEITMKKSQNQKRLRDIQENALIERINNGSIIYISPDTIPDKKIKIDAPKIISISDIKVHKQTDLEFEFIFEGIDEKNKNYIIYAKVRYQYKRDFLEASKSYLFQFRRKDMIDKSYSYVMYNKYTGTYPLRLKKKTLYIENRFWAVSKFEFLEEKDVFERLLELS